MKNIRGMVIASALAMLAAQASSMAAESPGKLRAEMTRAEREFIDLYNKVNTVPEFAMASRMETPTGSNFATRICQPNTSSPPTPGLPASACSRRWLPASTRARPIRTAPMWEREWAQAGDPSMRPRKKLKQNMLDTLQRSPELRALGDRRDDLQARYDEATKRKSSR